MDKKVYSKQKASSRGSYEVNRDTTFGEREQGRGEKGGTLEHLKEKRAKRF